MEERTNTSSLQDITTGCVKSHEAPPLKCVKLQCKRAVGGGDMTLCQQRGQRTLGNDLPLFKHHGGDKVQVNFKLT